MIGVVSNSDGRADVLARAVELFAASGADYLIHCGDLGGRHVLDVLARMRGAFVWGDRDNDRMGLMRYGHSLGIACFGSIGELSYQDRRLVIVHGDDKKLIGKLLDEQQYDYLLCGHVMTAEDRTAGRTRLINPGPLHGGAGKSAVLLDPSAGRLKLVAL